jgi:hydrophobe/amphiphile efflux-3 (HAE3) family protein
VGRYLSRRAATTSVAVLLITAVLGIGLGGLEFATGQDSYLDPSSQIAKDNKRYQSLFGGESMVVLFTAAQGTTVVDLFTPSNVAQFADIEQQLASSDAVQAVVSPVTLLQWTQDLITTGVASEIIARTIEREPDPVAAEARRRDALITTLRLGAAGAQTMDNPQWVSFLIFDNIGFTLDGDNTLVAPPEDERVVRKALRAFIPDARHAVFAAVLIGNASLDQQAAGSKAVERVLRDRAFDNASATVTGTPTFLTDINDYLQGGMLTLGGIAVLVMIVILLVAFKVRWRLLPLAGMVVGIAWGFGAFGLTGTKLSLVTITGLPILIGLGIEFAIQIQNRIEEELAGDKHSDAFATTFTAMGPPLMMATMAAVVAFMTVRISKVPMVQEFGVLLAIGIVALLVAGIIVPTTVIGVRERRSPRTASLRPTWVERTVALLGSLPRWTVLPLVVIAVGLPIVGLVLETGSRIESDPINWADQSSPAIRNARLLESETGFSSTLGLFVETSSAAENGVFTDQMGAFVSSLVARVTVENPELAEASSLATTVQWLAEVPDTTALPPTGLDMLQAYETAPAALQGLLVAQGGNATQVLFQVGPSSLERRADVLDRIHAAVADPGSDALLPAAASATTGGLAVVGVGLLENITAGRAALTIVAILLVGAFVILRSGDVIRGLLTLIPVLLAVGASATLVRVLGITLSPLTTVGGPLVVATCAEFSVLLVARYAEERRRGLDPEASTDVAAARTGRAFFTSALTTLGGFAVLMFSSFPLIADFGMVVTINIAVALLSALVIVPPLLKAADHHALLELGPAPPDRSPANRRVLVGWIAGLAMATTGISIAVASAQDDLSVARVTRSLSAIEAPATLPPPTTGPPPTTSLPPGETLPPGPAGRPVGLVGGAFWDGLVGAGVEPGVARCAADELLANTSEAELLALGIASVPRPPEVDALLEAAAARCGVTQAQLDAAAAGQ